MLFSFNNEAKATVLSDASDYLRRIIKSMELKKTQKCPASKANFTSAIRNELPYRNGGTICIDRKTTEEYVAEKTHEGNNIQREKVGLLPEVLAFKKSIDEDPILRMTFEKALEEIPKSGNLSSQ
jgi:hypothetical protein